MSNTGYPRYRASGIDWLGAIPDHWAVAPLKRIVAIPITDGPHETPDFVAEGIPFVSAEAVSGGIVDFSKVRGFISEHDHHRYSQKYLPQRGDIFIVKSGATTGVSAIVETDREFNIWSPLAAVRCKLGIHSKFLLYYVRSRNFLEAVTLFWSFGTQQNLGMGVLENLQVALPPLSEQAAIAAFLNRETAKIDALVEEQKRMIDLLKEKRQAVISHAVTKGLNPDAPMKDSGFEWPQTIPAHWEVLSLTRVVEQFVDYRGVTPTKLQEGIPLITATQIKNGRIDHSLDPVFISEDEYSTRMTRGFPQTGDVLLTTEAPLGEVAMIEEPRVSPGQRMILMKVDKSKVTNEFLYRHFQSDFGRNELAMRASGSTASGIRSDRLRGSAVLVPPLDEQRQIVTHIEEKTAGFDDLNVEIENQLDLLQERRSALISAAVTGKIDVRRAVEEDVAE